MDSSLDRYSRQIRFYGLGEEGQRRLLDSHVTLCGCGALGTVLANALVRAGVGHLRLVDRDFIETNNLQRQVLFDEHDVAENLPKAEAAARKLGAINSSVYVEPIVTDIDRTNILELVKDADLILDGTDNFEIRYLINDVQVSHRTATRLNFEEMARHLEVHGEVSYNRFLLKFDAEGYQFTVFPD